MRIRVTALCLALAMQGAQASDKWRFETRIALTGEPLPGIYHHLEGSGRRHIAVSAQSVAVTWEDNRSGDPQIYVAYKDLRQQRFASELQVSSGTEAYEPSIAALPGGRFLIAWEQDGVVFTRILSDGGLSEPVKLASATASQATVAAIGKRAFAAWREQTGRAWTLKVAALGVSDDNQLRVDAIRSVESDPLKTPVLFPALAVNSAGLCIAWEDRRAGHTRLLFSHSPDAARTFSQPQHLNEFFSNRNPYDQGNGVTRVSMASFAQDEVLAAWMDKRRNAIGYGIFSALGAEGGDNFGPNEKVHGFEGDKQPHYNPATAGNEKGDFVVAWDDFRRGDSDLWISNYNDDEEWSEDHAPAVASGIGEQSHPSIALDARGVLHLLWMERADLNAPSRLWYSAGWPKTE